MVWLITIPSLLLIALFGAGYIQSRKRADDPKPPTLSGVLHLFGRAYCRLVHKLRVEEEPGSRSDLAGPLIVVCNHTAGIDPIVVSVACPRHIRWVMAEDMRIPRINWFWNWQGVIFVSRKGTGRKGLRHARAHLHDQGAIGIFPEGRLERPARQLLPFAPGVGVLVKRTNARVLPVIIEGTPTEAKTAWAALWTRSNTRVRFMRPVSYADSQLTPAEIAADLQHRFASWTGWPVKSHAPAGRLEPTDDPESSTDTEPTRSIA